MTRRATCFSGGTMTAAIFSAWANWRATPGKQLRVRSPNWRNVKSYTYTLAPAIGCEPQWRSKAMPLDSNQSGPGNRISAPDGTEHDVVARIATDGGPYVILAPADGEGLVAGSLVSEGALRDHEDVAYV